MLRTTLHQLPPTAGPPASAAGPTSARWATSLAETPSHRLAWERANRLGLLMIHGFVGLFAGLLILFTGSAQAIETHGAWGRPLTGGLALVGGALLVSGLMQRPRVLSLEVAGLLVLAMWDLAMAGSFLTSAMEAGDLVATWPWQAVSQLPAVRLYPIAIYLGLFLMMCVHLVTLRQLQRGAAFSDGSVRG